MSACSGELMIFWALLITIFWGNHHNNPHNSLLWPITQTRRVRRPKKQPSRVQRTGQLSGESARFARGDCGCAGGGGCCGWWGRGCGWTGEDRRPPKTPDTPSIPCLLPHCVVGLLPVCFAQPFVLIILPSIRAGRQLISST